MLSVTITTIVLGEEWYFTLIPFDLKKKGAFKAPLMDYFLSSAVHPTSLSDIGPEIRVVFPGFAEHEVVVQLCVPQVLSFLQPPQLGNNISANTRQLTTEILLIIEHSLFCTFLAGFYYKQNDIFFKRKDLIVY